MTKNIVKITMSLMIAVMAIACTDEDGDSIVGFSLGVYEKQPIEMTAVGGKEFVYVATHSSLVST